MSDNDNKGLTPFVPYEVDKAEKKKALEDVQKILKGFDKPPKMVAVHKFEKFEYVPISHIESILDTWFFGLWSVHSFKYMQVVNEIVGDLTLEVKHPVTGDTIKRVGSASVPIMQDKDSKLSDFVTTKKKNALVMGFPRLKAECFKNAAQSFGKIFGRDLRRDLEDNYSPLIPEEKVNMYMKVIDALDIYQGEDKKDIQEMCASKQKAGEFNDTFANQILERINGTAN